MRNNETGEYELVVGNRQLLSGFFIVVLLCAVAFAMGYVVGENSHTVKETASAAGSSSKPLDTRPDAASPAAPDTKGSVPDPAPPPVPESTPAPATAAAAEAPPQPTTRPVRETTEPEPRKRPAESVRAPVPESKMVVEPASGQYWQVAATNNRDSAETLMQTLKDKGFPAALSPGPNNLTRVLVGPYTDTAALGRAKTELEANGFNHMVRK